MTLSYNKTWEVMNGLEESFNRIVALEHMIGDLQEAVDNDDKQSIIDLTHAMNAFITVYIRQYEKASQRAWNNTVGEVRKVDNPYKKYEEVLEYIKNEDDVDIDLS